MPVARAARAIRSKGLSGVVQAASPARLVDRWEARRLRARLTMDLARLWCGQLESVAGVRAQLLESMLRHAAQAVPYYRRLFRSAGIRRPRVEDLQRLPLLDKSVIRQQGRDFLCPGWSKHAHYPMNTGGSTGQPLEFIVDGRAGVAAAAHQEFAMRLMGFRNGDRIAAFAGLTVPEELRRRNVFWVSRPAPGELPYGSVCFASHYMDERTLPFTFEEIERVGYRFFHGYPSAVHALARYCLSTGRQFSRPIAAVQLTSEIALEEQIRDIESAFRTRVLLQYGHSEVCFYAHTHDRSGEYWCSPLMGWVEVVDGAGRTVGTGEEGEVVVTGFHNRLMPFIRYRTGDRAVFGGERDGVVTLTTVLGRSQDYVVRADGSKVPLTGLVFGQHFKAFARIHRWQIVQDEPGRVKISVIPHPGFGPADTEELRATFRHVGAIDADVELVSEIPRTARGKHLFLISRIP